MSKNVIEISNVTKIYRLYDKPIHRVKESLSILKKRYHKDHYALNNISLTIKKGETVGVIGTNGSGKSTLLKLITGVLSPSEGNIYVDGKISALLELGAGFNPEYTGIENIYLNGSMMGFNKQQIKEKEDSIISFADIGDFIHQPVKTYSSGMFVRLAFAVAINIEPEILIVDEALSVGDVFFQAKCYQKFEEFKNSGKTILFVTHDLGSIMKYCDRAVLLNKGELYGDDTPKIIIDMYKKVLVNQHHIMDSNENLSLKSVQFQNVEWKINMDQNPNFSEYGNKKAEIVDYAIFDNQDEIKNTVMKNEYFAIKIRVRFNETIKNPIFAFTLKDLKGNDLSGTNTVIENVNTGEVYEGEIRTLEFRQLMNLQGGQYLLSLGCTGFEGDNFVVYHRLYDICCVGVISYKNSVGFFDMNSDVIMT